MKFTGSEFCGGFWTSRMCRCITGQWFLVLWKNILPLLSRVHWT